MNPLVLAVPEWLHQKGDPGVITASQVATALEENPYESACSLCMFKMGKSQRTLDSIPMRRGRFMEPFVAELYAEETGEYLTDPGPTTVWQHPIYPWLYATPDRLNSAMQPRELKAPNINQWENWRTPPRHYWIQVQIQMQCLDVSQGRLIGLINDSLVVHDIERDQDWFDEAVTRLLYFRDRCLTNDPPPPRPRDAAYALETKKDNGLTVDRPDLFGVCEERDWMIGRMQGIESEVAWRTDQIKIAMGEASELTCGQFRFTWKGNKHGTRTFRGGKRNG